MIFVPEKKSCAIWRDCGDYVNIYYKVNPTPDNNNAIDFKWWKKNGKTDDPYYLEVQEVLNHLVLPCSLDACRCQPQLRYNDIIKKWYCNCSSSALGTKNDDEDEIKTLIYWAKGEYTEEKGFCDDPINAILRWNISLAEDYKFYAEELLKDRNNSPYLKLLMKGINDNENTCDK